MLTRKHYEAIAEIVKMSFAGDCATEYELPTLARRLADYFAAEYDGNYEFDREQFMATCGLI